MDKPPLPIKFKLPELRSWLYIGIIVVAAGAVGGLSVWMAQKTIEQNVKLVESLSQPEFQKEAEPEAKSTDSPQITTEIVLAGRDHVWEMAFLPSKEMLFTERNGTLSVVKDGTVSTVAKIDDVYARGEGGLLGMTVDPEFSQNRQIYTCYNSSKGGPDVRVVRWRLKEDLSGLEQRNDIVTGMPSNGSGRHSGCRLAFGIDGHLYVGTGDAAQGDNGIDPKSLGGKILRVDRDGKAVANGLSGEFDARIFSYGHRNVQGIAFFKQETNGLVGISVEHGSTVDDEMDPLIKGNFGWAPVPSGYNESGVPMTDKQRFPDAVEAIWKSGNPTQAPSGATILNGRQWKAWDGAVAMAVLKAKHLKILILDDKNAVSKEEKLLQNDFGRIRAATQGPDGNLYISTDNGSDDKIVRVIPH